MAGAAGPLWIVLEGAEGLQNARHCLSEWLEDVPGAEAVASDVVSAAAELCTNALTAATSKVELQARVEGQSVVVDVTDDGPGMACGLPEEPPGPLAESGRGLYVARQLADVLWISARPGGGTRATFALRLTP
ncbi:MAG: ATP-binding protein [Actinobacteria bacterium]|nr:ATP-binding protein [Actinomycetota bacterium]